MICFFPGYKIDLVSFLVKSNILIPIFDIRPYIKLFSIIGFVYNSSSIKYCSYSLLLLNDNNSTRELKIKAPED